MMPTETDILRHNARFIRDSLPAAVCLQSWVARGQMTLDKMATCKQHGFGNGQLRR